MTILGALEQFEFCEERSMQLINTINKNTGVLGIFLAYLLHITSLKAMIVRLQAVNNSPNAPMYEVDTNLVHRFPREKML